MNEKIVLVDQHGRVIGEAPKLSSHGIDTPLHLGFSCYLFNRQGKFLLTRRALSKKVWPGVWTNSVCGHPSPGESNEAAVARRAEYELGLDRLTDLELILGDYRYRTPPYNGIVENEVCPVFFGLVDKEPQPNPDEVEEFKWVDWTSVERLIDNDPQKYSYWFKDQLQQLKSKDLSRFTHQLNN